LTPPDLDESPGGHERSTAELVRLARQGNHDAFALLVMRHERMVLRTALRLLGRLDRAEDAAQETFLRLFRYLGRYDETREMGPWLYRVVVNVCRDICRKSGPRLVPLEDALHEAPPGSPGGPQAVEGDVARAEERRLVQAALVALPEKERAALVLRDLEGRPTSEVARILGSSEGTVRSQVSTARLKIRAFIRGPRGATPRAQSVARPDIGSEALRGGRGEGREAEEDGEDV
jgi:RNA polymerase sigma-70 factor (ECF subfamily)